MRYYKIVDDGFVLAIGMGSGNIEITEKEYNELQRIIAERPVAQDDCEYRLKEDLTWELYKLPLANESEQEAVN